MNVKVKARGRWLWLWPFRTAAFARVDLMAILAVLVILCCLGGSAPGRMRPHSYRAYCANNLRQINQALLIYATEHEGKFPPRVTPNAWPTRLLPFYKEVRLLVCPSDGPLTPPTFGTNPNYPAEIAPRSYIFNGWNDFFRVRYDTTSFQFMRSNSIRMVDIPQPGATITFGEKENGSGHMTADMEQYDDLASVDLNRHDRSDHAHQRGGSNHGFADGSVHFLRYGESLAPVFLWATTELWRTNAIVMP